MYLIENTVASSIYVFTTTSMDVATIENKNKGDKKTAPR